MRIQAIIETAIYVDDLQAAETFYEAILGLRVMGNGAEALRCLGAR